MSFSANHIDCALANQLQGFQPITPTIFCTHLGFEKMRAASHSHFFSYATVSYKEMSSFSGQITLIYQLSTIKCKWESCHVFVDSTYALFIFLLLRLLNVNVKYLSINW